jgi:hypothetical protein
MNPDDSVGPAPEAVGFEAQPFLDGRAGIAERAGGGQECEQEWWCIGRTGPPHTYGLSRRAERFVPSCPFRISSLRSDFRNNISQASLEATKESATASLESLTDIRIVKVLPIAIGEVRRMAKIQVPRG